MSLHRSRSKPVGIFFSACSLPLIEMKMKCFLLLAAVYSLIIHQWHKEKETAKSQLQADRQVNLAKKQEKDKPPVTTAIHFQKALTQLYDE